MNQMIIGSNVFYLPAPAPTPAAARRPSRFTELWGRLTGAWWRFRFAISEIRSILQHGNRRFAADDYAGFLDGTAELVDRRPRCSQPARVIDFDAARARRRPSAEA